jgi:hypothetical protein
VPLLSAAAAAGRWSLRQSDRATESDVHVADKRGGEGDERVRGGGACTPYRWRFVLVCKCFCCWCCLHLRDLIIIFVCGGWMVVQAIGESVRSVGGSGGEYIVWCAG